MPARMDHLDYLEDWTASATEPATTEPGDLWLDTSADPHVLKRRNAADTGWVTVGASGGSVAVDDDGTEVVAEASRLNFGTGLAVTDDTGGEVTIDLSGAGSYAETIGDGTATSFTVTHNLGTEDVHVQVWDVSGTDPALANGDPSSVEATDTDTVTVVFGTAPTTDQYRVVVLASGAADSGGGESQWEWDSVTGEVDIGPTPTFTSGGSYDEISAYAVFDVAIKVDAVTVHAAAAGEYAIIIDGQTIWTDTISSGDNQRFALDTPVEIGAGVKGVRWVAVDGLKSLRGRDSDYFDAYSEWRTLGGYRRYSGTNATGYTVAFTLHGEAGESPLASLPH